MSVESIKDTTKGHWEAIDVNWTGYTGPIPKFNHPQELWEACVGYFEWVKANPIIVEETINYQGTGNPHNTYRPRVMTITALCVHLGIGQSTWKDYRRERGDLIPVIEMVQNIIWANKYEGAAVNLFNSQMVSRDLGLTEKVEQSSRVVVNFDETDSNL